MNMNMKKNQLFKNINLLVNSPLPNVSVILFNDYILEYVSTYLYIIILIIILSVSLIFLINFKASINKHNLKIRLLMSLIVFITFTFLTKYLSIQLSLTYLVPLVSSISAMLVFSMVKYVQSDYTNRKELFIVALCAFTFSVILSFYLNDIFNFLFTFLGSNAIIELMNNNNNNNNKTISIFNILKSIFSKKELSYNNSNLLLNNPNNDLPNPNINLPNVLLMDNNDPYRVRSYGSPHLGVSSTINAIDLPPHYRIRHYRPSTIHPIEFISHIEGWNHYIVKNLNVSPELLLPGIYSLYDYDDEMLGCYKREPDINYSTINAVADTLLDRVTKTERMIRILRAAGRINNPNYNIWLKRPLLSEEMWTIYENHAIINGLTPQNGFWYESRLSPVYINNLTLVWPWNINGVGVHDFPGIGFIGIDTTGIYHIDVQGSLLADRVRNTSSIVYILAFLGASPNDRITPVQLHQNWFYDRYTYQFVRAELEVLTGRRSPNNCISVDRVGANLLAIRFEIIDSPILQQVRTRNHNPILRHVRFHNPNWRNGSN